MQSKKPYGEIENEMRRLSVNCSSVLTLGDLNSHTKVCKIMYIRDNAIFENLNMADIFDEFCNLNFFMFYGK